MSGKTSIEWTAQPGYRPAVWNPTTGCTRVSDGCDNCYAFALHDKRFKANLDAARSQAPFPVHPNMTAGTLSQAARSGAAALPFPKQYDLPFSRVQLLEDRLDVPLRTRKPTCYFVDSMADLFHEDVPDEFLERVFAVMRRDGARHHRFLILTKRPDRMAAYARDRYVTENVWLGTSVEDQRSADERIPHLLATPAAVRFLSCEPLLGPVNLRGAECVAAGHPPRYGDYLGNGIDWVIVGGESGHGHRRMDLSWMTSLIEQCRSVDVPVFVKQDSGPRPGMQGRIPDEMWIKEWPR